MKNLTLIILASFLLLERSAAQNTFKAIIKEAQSKSVLVGAAATLKNTTQGASSNTEGVVEITNLPDGNQTLVFSFVGYETLEKTFSFPLVNAQLIDIELVATVEGLGEVIVEGTRSNRSIENIPTRVEVLTEEIDEASTMDPSKIAHLITHSTGIQVQQTSATTNTANVRIQGLDGRYTQILKDGFPIYGGFSGSLSIMQIPPLDLRQVEYIKGGASTLYGGGAISGLINLLSKEPKHNETLFHLNVSQIGALDVNTFVSRKFEKTGFTLLAQRNTHRIFDADKDGFSDMPELTKYNLNPKLFFYFDKNTTLNVGATLTNEVRKGR
ncbi:MAG: TonB-dependent receptor plug domain-containing protein [Saprospiraceae bacterium]|nr:TonB-dependent receptor plug domain-containing protein [Saprospiraceae bacterium]